MKVPETFLELTGGRADLAREIEAVYGGDLAKVDTMIGMLAEPYPEGFAFSDTRVPHLHPDGLAAAEERPLLHRGLHAGGLHPGWARLDRRPTP